MLSEARGKNRPEFLQAWQAGVTECVPTEKMAMTVESFAPRPPPPNTHTKSSASAFSEGSLFRVHMQTCLSVEGDLQVAVLLLACGLKFSKDSGKSD